MLAAAAGALLGLLATAPAAGHAATAASFDITPTPAPSSPSPTAKATPAPTPTPPPTPCPSDPVSSVVCTVNGQPTATPAGSPSPTPSGTAKPKPTPTSAAAAGHTAAPTPSASPTVSPSAKAASAATLAAVAATFRNAPFLQPLLDILAHPTTAQQPDLVHFRIPSATPQDPLLGADGLPLTSAEDPPVAAAVIETHRGWSVLAGILCGLLAGGLAGARTPGGRVLGLRLAPAIRRRSRRLAATRIGRALPQTATGRRLTAGVVIAVLPLALSLAVAGTAQHRSAAAVVPDTSTVARTAVIPAIAAARVGDAQARTATMDATAAALPQWNQLLSIEKGIAEQQDQLAQQEQEITRLATLAQPQAPTAGADQTPGAPATPDAATQQQLAALVQIHDQTKAQLQQSLQAEYALYRTAAQDPGVQQQLLQGAAAAPIPDARKAVDDDLGRLQTELSQEKVIDDARTKLAALGSLGQRQLDAIQKHQPFIVPEVAPLAQPFGPTDFSMEPPITINGVFYPHFHTGLDLAGALDTPIHAAADGVVIVAQASTDGAGHLVGYGNYVVIAHPDGFLTLYGHLDSLAVKQGQVIHQGEIVGQEGSTGWSTGPHLHFEIRHDGAFLDPLPYVKTQLGL